MHQRRTTALVLIVLGALGAAACGSSSSSAPTTAAPTTPTTAQVIGAPSAGLCAEIAQFSKQEQGLVSADGGASNSLGGLHSYAGKSKQAFDQAAPRITTDLASAPPAVQSAWATLQPQVDQLFTAAMTATSLDGFARAAGSIESTNAFINANDTLSRFVQGACPQG